MGRGTGRRGEERKERSSKCSIHYPGEVPNPFFNLGDHIGGFSYHGKLLFGAFLCGTSVHRFGPYGLGSSHAKSKAVTSMVVRKNNCLMQGDRAQSIHVKAFTSKVRPVCKSKLPGKKGASVGHRGPSRRRVSQV